MRATEWSVVIFTVKKSGVPGEIVGHACSGALHAFPVVVLEELCLLLRKHGALHNAPLGTYREIPSGPLCYINSSDITKALKSASRVHGAEFGIGDVATIDVAQRARGDLSVCPQQRIMGSSMLA